MKNATFIDFVEGVSKYVFHLRLGLQLEEIYQGACFLLDNSCRRCYMLDVSVSFVSTPPFC